MPTIEANGLITAYEVDGAGPPLVMLPGQGGFVDLERGRPDDPAVRGHKVACLDVHDVAGNQVLHRDLGDLAAPPNLGLDDHHLLERRDACLGLALLVHAHEGVEHGQHHEHDPGRNLAGQEQAHNTGDQQHELHRVAVLPEERPPAGLLRCIGKLVSPVGRAPTVHLGGRESGSGIHRQRLEHRLGRQRMPRLLGLRGCRRSLLGHQ